MRGSNRIILLVGILLAAIAFVATVMFVGQRPAPTAGEPARLPTVYARVDIALGTVVTADMVEVRPLEVSVRPIDAIGDTGLVIGRTVRTDLTAGQQITEAVFSGAADAADLARLLEPGLRGFAVAVDQSTGVGTLITIGDRVDLIIAISGPERFPLVTLDPQTGTFTPLTSYNATTTKVLIQGLQVIGTLLSVTPAAEGETPTSGTAFTGRQQLVILAVTAQQAELIRFAQLDGLISLALRSPRDFQAADGSPTTPPADGTSGIILRTLIEEYGVLPPELIEAVGQPAPAATPEPSPSP